MTTFIIIIIIFPTNDHCELCFSLFLFFLVCQLLQQLKRLICDLCRLYNLPQHPDVEMLDQPLPAGPVDQERKVLTQGLNKNLTD